MDPTNTTIADTSGNALYSIKTHVPHKENHSHTHTVTRVCGSQGQILAALEWHDAHSDLVGLGKESVELYKEGNVVGLKKGKEIKFDKWMKSSIIPFDSYASLVDEKGRKYKWKGCAPGETLGLHTQDSGPGIIAHFQLPEADHRTPAQIYVAPRSKEILDTVVISFLFLEKHKCAVGNPVFANVSDIRTGDEKLFANSGFL